MYVNVLCTLELIRGNIKIRNERSLDNYFNNYFNKYRYELYVNINIYFISMYFWNK